MPPTLNSVPLWALFAYTPWWVYLIFAVLLLTGLLATRPRRIQLWRMMITPLVFLIWGITAVVLRHSAPLFAVWAVAFLVTAVAAFVTARFSLTVDAGGATHLPGSWWTLVRVMTIFVARYVLAILIIFQPARRDLWVLADVTVSGLSAGYFFGWGAAFVRAYLQERRSTVASPTPA